MAALRQEIDVANEKCSELTAKTKTLEQENLQKEQEITSLSHRNQLLEADLEKLEEKIKELKTSADSGANSSQEVESLQRKVQLLEEEAEEADKNLRETNEKYVLQFSRSEAYRILIPFHLGYASPMSRPSTTNEKSQLLRPSVTSGRRSTKRTARRSSSSRRSWQSSPLLWIPCKRPSFGILVTSFTLPSPPLLSNVTGSLSQTSYYQTQSGSLRGSFRL